MLLNGKANKPRVLKYPGTDKYNLRTLLESSDETEEEALWDFVELKHDFLYKDCDDGVRLPLEKPFIPMTPIEVFQKPPLLLRRQMFFKSLDRGDILYLRVENESYDSYKLLPLAMHQGCWKIDDLSIVMYLPKYEQEMKLLDSPIEISSLIRAAFCSCWLRERRLYVTLDNSIVKAEFKALNLGKLPETDLPHYIGNPFLGISYTDYVFTTTEFWYPKWTLQLPFLGIDRKGLYSHFNNLERKKYSQFECAPHLKMKQSVLLSQSHYRQALHCFEHDMPNIAVVHLDNALSVCAENVEALLLRGKLHSSFGNLKQAFIDTEDAVRLDPTYIPARKQMSNFLVDAAKAHMEQGNEIKARESLAVARELDSSNKEAFLPIEKIRDQMNNNLDSQEYFAKQMEYIEPIPLPAIYLQYKKKKSKKHHRKRSRHHHKRSKPKSPAYPIFLPGRKSPIPPPPAYPWDSPLTEPGQIWPLRHETPKQPTNQPLAEPGRLLPSNSLQKNNTFSSSKRLMSSVYSIPQTLPPLVSPLPQKRSSSILPSLQDKPPHVLPTLRSNKSHPPFLQNPPIIHSTRKSPPVIPLIRSLHCFHKQSPPHCAPRSSSPTQNQSRSPPIGLCRSMTPSEDLHNKLVPQDLDRSRSTQDFCGSRLPPRSLRRSRSPRGLRSRSPPRSLHISRSPPRGLHRSRSPALHRSRSLYQSLRSRSPHWGFHRSRSPSPDLRRSRSPSPDLRRSRSPSPGLRRSRSPSPDLRRSRSPSVELCMSRSPSPELHRNESPYRGLCRSRSPTRDLRRNRSPPRELHRSRSPPRRLHRSRSQSPPWYRNRSRSPPQGFHRSRSPPRSLREDRSSPHVLPRSYDLSRRSPTRGLSKRLRTHGLYERSIMPGLSERSEMHGLSEQSTSYGLSGRSTTHVPSETRLKRKELIKSILEKRSGRVAPTLSFRRSPMQGLPERSPNQSISQVSANQGVRERSPTNDHSHLDRWSIPTVTYQRRPLAYNMPERSPIQSLPNRSTESHSERSIPTVPTQRKRNKSSFSYRKNTEF